ncbi:hypothetical protein ACFVXH_01790 [Kitasatospora sp. NPDC058184]|uniref:hypothetical protein n=1 Tax=Kitasatospora sp. NPDC058184 TaxID=3346370 RepID=UPI0036DE8342
MRTNGQVVRVKVSGATKGTTVIVELVGRAGEVSLPTPEPRRSRRLGVLLAVMLIRAFSGSAALALMHWAQRIRWAEALHWLTP